MCMKHFKLMSSVIQIPERLLLYKNFNVPSRFSNTADCRPAPIIQEYWFCLKSKATLVSLFAPPTSFNRPF